MARKTAAPSRNSSARAKVQTHKAVTSRAALVRNRISNLKDFFARGAELAEYERDPIPDARGDARLVDSTAFNDEWEGGLETNCCYSKDARFGAADVIRNIYRP
jgi:hypothetical protein